MLRKVYIQGANERGGTENEALSGVTNNESSEVEGDFSVYILH